MARLETYHFAWLAKHPNRDEAWLIDRLVDGFHVHHLDHDHANDDPENLVLIEGDDHMELHGRCIRSELVQGRERKKRAKRDDGRTAYQMKSRDTSWSMVGAQLWPASLNPGAQARAAAKTYAEAAGLPFPKPGANSPTHGQGAIAG